MHPSTTRLSLKIDAHWIAPVFQTSPWVEAVDNRSVKRDMSSTANATLAAENPSCKQSTFSSGLSPSVQTETGSSINLSLVLDKVSDEFKNLFDLRIKSLNSMDAVCRTHFSQCNNFRTRCKVTEALDCCVGNNPINATASGKLLCTAVLPPE